MNRANSMIYFSIFAHLCNCSVVTPVLHGYLQHLDNKDSSSFAIQINLNLK